MKKFCDILGSRWFQFTVIPLATLIWFFVTDPSHGSDTLLRIQLWAQALLIIGMAYLISKAMLGRASSEALYDQAVANNIAAGIAYTGICLLRAIVLFGLLTFFAQVQR